MERLCIVRQSDAGSTGSLKNNKHDNLRTMKTQKKLGAVFLIVILMVMMCACTKEKEQGNLQSKNEADKEQIQFNDRVALAKRDDAGQIVNLLKVEDIQKRINANRSEEEQYVIESYEITSATDDSPYILTISYFDLYENCAYNVGFAGDYLEEIANVIYAKENVVKGNYDIAITNDSIARCIEGVFSQLANPGPDYCPPGWFVRCSPSNCRSGGCKPTWSGLQALCSDCEPQNTQLASSCTASNGAFWNAVTAIANLWKALFSK